MAVNPLDIKITSTADTSGVDQMSDALKKQKDIGGQVAKEMQWEAQLWEMNERKTREAAAAKKNLAGELGNLQKAGQGVNQVLGGLSQGSLTGLIQAGRGAITVFRSLATGALGVTLLPALAAAAAAFAFLSKKANEGAEAIKKVYDDADKNRAAYQQGLEEIKKASEKHFDAMVADVKRLTSAYAELIGTMDEAAARVGRLREAEQEAALAKIDRDEAAALAGAKTDVQRDTIKSTAAAARAGVKQQYTGAALESDVLNAKNREEQAVRQLSSLGAKQDEANNAVVSAQQQYDTALGLIGQNRDSEEYYTRVREAKLAKERLDAAISNRDRLRQESQPLISAAEKEISSARETQEVAGLKRQAFDYRTEAESTTRQTSVTQTLAERAKTAQGRVAGVESRIQNIYEEERNLAPGWDSDRRNQLAAELAAASQERDELYKVISDSTRAQTQKDADLKRTLQNTSESGAGR